MKRKTLLILTVLGLAALALWLHQRSAPTSLDAPLSNFSISDTARVDRIFISDVGGKTIDLRRNGRGWTLNGAYNARTSDVDLLLTTFKRIEVRSPVTRKAQATALRFMGAVAKRVEIYQGGNKPEKVWIVGHATKENLGTYMVLELPGKGRSSAPFIMGMSGFTGILNTRFRTELDTWRSPEVWNIIDPYELARLEVDLPKGPGSPYRIEHLEDRRVRLLDGANKPLPTDSTVLKMVLRSFKGLNYEAIERRMKGQTRDSLLAATPDQVVRTFDRSGKRKEARFWFMPYTGAADTTLAYQPEHDPNRMYALVDDSLVVVVQRAMFDPILQPAENLLP
jgi:hypothetical protein